jgi:TonB family protein
MPQERRGADGLSTSGCRIDHAGVFGTALHERVYLRAGRSLASCNAAAYPDDTFAPLKLGSIIRIRDIFLPPSDQVRRMIRLASVALTIALFSSGCALHGTVAVSDTRAVAYDEDVDRLRASYVRAAESLGMMIEEESEGEVVVTSPEERVRHRLHFGSGDTLRSLVRIASRYAPFMQEDHEALGRMVEHVRMDIGETGAYTVPAAVYPRGARDCEGPRYIGVSNRTAPVLHGGMPSIMLRLRYPAEARSGNVEGRVMVDVVVSEEGQVECAVVREGLPGGLSEEALHAVTQATFDPAMIDGEPVRMMLSLTIAFANITR